MKVIFLDFDGVLNSHEHFEKIDHSLPPTAEETIIINELCDKYETTGNMKEFYGYDEDKIAEIRIRRVLRDVRQLSKELVMRVDNLSKLTGAKIVISSFWRYGHTIPVLECLLAYHGFSSPIIGTTPIHVPPPSGHKSTLRGHEIQIWLDNNPDVESFVILDDDSDMDHLMEYLVQTNFSHGITDSNVQSAITILNS